MSLAELVCIHRVNPTVSARALIDPVNGQGLCSTM